MAKIIYDKSPLDPSKRIIKNYEKEITLGEALDDLKVFQDCSIEINGMTPDKIDQSRILKDNDLIRIRLPLHGSGNDRKVIGRAIQIIGLIVSVATAGTLGPVGAALVAAGSSLVGGLISASGQKPVSVPSAPEGQQAAQVFNLTAAQNEIRKMQPINLPMGSHRYGPDFNSQPYKCYTDSTVPPEEARIWTTTQIAVDTDNPVTLPAGWISDKIYSEFSWVTNLGAGTGPNPPTVGWWQWPVKVPWNFYSQGIDTIFIGDAYRSVSGATFHQDYMNMTTLAPFILPLAGTLGSGIPGHATIPILHDDPNDPVVIANGGQPFYSSLQALCWIYFSQYRWDETNSAPNDFYTLAHGNGIIPSAADFQNLYLYFIGLEASIPLPPAPISADAIAGTDEAYQNLYRNKDFFNNGISYFLQFDETTNFISPTNPVIPISAYTPSPDNFVINGAGGAVDKGLLDFYFDDLQTVGGFSSRGRFELLFDYYSEPQVEEVRHIFNHGIGDLDVLDRRIGETELDRIYGHVNLRNTRDQTEWPIDQDEFHTNVKVYEGADLLNNETFSGPVGLESTALATNGTESNWITRESPDHCFRVQINIEGRSFESLDSGAFDLLPALFEVQIRDVNTGVFTIENGALTLASDKPDLIRFSYYINVPVGKYELRIRKRTKDPETGQTRKVQEFKVVTFNFYIEDETPHVSENREGLKIEGTGSFSGTTQRYNTLIEASTWTDTTYTTWEKTRNPAWWFLYFARGGFVNPVVTTPNIGWHNGFDADNVERIFGAGLKDSEIDLQKIEEWALFCDNNNLRCDFIFRNDQSVHEILQRIANAGRASVTYWCSELSVVYEDPDDEVVGMFGMSNILKGSFNMTFAVEDVPYKIVGKFTDRDNEWQTHKVEALIPNSDPENVTIEEVVLDGITELDRAQREVNILAARQAYQRRTYNWNTSVEGITVRRGDKVYLSHDITCYNQSGRFCGATVVGGFVTELHTSVCLDPTSKVLIRSLDGEINSYDATNSVNNLILSTPIPLNQMPMTLDQEGTDNPLSPWHNSHIEDLIFFSGPEETPGKVVRILSVEPFDGINTFKITAVEEDPVIWAFEYDISARPEREDHECIEAKVTDACYEIQDDGLVKLSFDFSGSHGVYINEIQNGITIPVTSQGGYSFFEDCAILDLPAGGIYNLIIEPFVFGSDFKKTSYNITVRT